MGREDRIFENRFNINLPFSRLIAVTSYAHQMFKLKSLQIDYFDANIGAASAL